MPGPRGARGATTDVGGARRGSGRTRHASRGRPQCRGRTALERTGPTGPWASVDSGGGRVYGRTESRTEGRGLKPHRRRNPKPRVTGTSPSSRRRYPFVASSGHRPQTGSGVGAHWNLRGSLTHTRAGAPAGPARPRGAAPVLRPRPPAPPPRPRPRRAGGRVAGPSTPKGPAGPLGPGPGVRRQGLLRRR